MKIFAMTFSITNKSTPRFPTLAQMLTKNLLMHSDYSNIKVYTRTHKVIVRVDNISIVKACIYYVLNKTWNIDNSKDMNCYQHLDSLIIQYHFL